MRITQEDCVGDNVQARDSERLAVGRELKRSDLIRREVRQPVARRAIKISDGLIESGAYGERESERAVERTSVV